MRAALALLLIAPLASADVLVVSPTGPYTQIQDAVNAANDGDLVLVKPGTYSAFTIQAKSLTVVGDANPLVTVQGAANVSDLTVGQTVSLIRLKAIGASTGSAAARVGLYSNNNQGSVRCQGCTFLGADWDPTHLDGYDAAWIDTSSDVSLVDCTTYGGGGASDGSFPAGGCGVRSQSSTLTIFDCTINAGWGAESPYALGMSGNGGIGLHASGCTIFGSHSTIHGGPGGFGGQFLMPYPGLGGAGVDLEAGSLMRVLNCTFSGGSDGDAWETGGGGPPYLGTTYDFLPGTARTQTVAPNPLRELHSVNLSFHGAPGEQVYLLVGLETGVQWDPLRLANFLIAPPQYRTLLLGTTNSTGSLSRSLPFGDLGGTTQSQIYYLQPLFSGAGGAQQVGTPVTLAVLDQAF